MSSNPRRPTGEKKKTLRKPSLLLFEAGAALLLFGALIHQPQLERHGAAALAELQARGYRTPTGDDPVRVYAAKTEAAFRSIHAGGWSPGVISLREAPLGPLGPEVYLRHELMHEASFRTCRGKLPLWAEEAAAMDFSGELAAQPDPTSPAEAELDRLRERVRIGASLDPSAYRTLGRLVATSGWPRSPCGIAEPIASLLHRDAVADSFSFVLISLYSGRVLEARGDLATRHPPGSLLKIPYVAALQSLGDKEQLAAMGRELATSDTERLLARLRSLDPEQLAWLLALVKEAELNRFLARPPEQWAAEQDRRSLLGERDRDGRYPLEASLSELALMLRASLLLSPERWSGLADNGTLPDSTLGSQPEPQRAVLKTMRALSKTGTAADPRGMPLVGHLLVAWPQDAPRYLAVFRTLGANGAANLGHAARFLEQWSHRYPAASGLVRVRLMSLTPRDSWEIIDTCPSREQAQPAGGRLRFSTCGEFSLLSTARSSRTERLVRGVLERSPDDRTVVLLTDPETYGDAVLAAEAQDLRGEALAALRAVIVWNGLHGLHRHPATRSLCDTTHCMAFQGQPAAGPERKPRITAPELLARLDRIAREKKLDWLPFSEGGSEQWEKRLTVDELHRSTNEPTLLDLRRERGRDGEVRVHLLYPESEETVSCEIFRSRLKLPSCPETIRFDPVAGIWTLSGIGKGHGLGLSVDRARTLARAGADAAAILTDAYR